MNDFEKIEEIVKHEIEEGVMEKDTIFVDVTIPDEVSSSHKEKIPKNISTRKILKKAMKSAINDILKFPECYQKVENGLIEIKIKILIPNRIEGFFNDKPTRD